MADERHGTVCLSPLDSSAIKMARFLCIFFMCFVHIYGQDYIAGPILRTSEAIIMDVFGRASVPLLSAISGYLAVITLKDVGFFQIGYKKFKALVVPMAFWNCVAILFGILVFLTVSVKISFYEHIENRDLSQILGESILALNYESVQTSHNFLRDVFVCFLLFPVLYRCVTYSGGLVLAAVLLIIYTIGTSPVIYREHIILFFTLGIVCAHHGITLTTISRGWLLSFPLFGIIVASEFLDPLLLWLQQNTLDYNLLKRIVVAHVMLCIALRAAQYVPRRQQDNLNDITFVTFLIHNIAFAIMWIPFQTLVVRGATDLYVLYFFSAPILIWGVAYLLRRLSQFAPKTLQILMFGTPYVPRPARKTRTSP